MQQLAHSINILLREACGNGIRFCTNILLREACGDGIWICHPRGGDSLIKVRYGYVGLGIRYFRGQFLPGH